MSNEYITLALRRLVGERASFCCEYCHINDTDTFLGCQIDHIISEKHGGQTIADNLAYACAFCNRYKGSDIGSISSAGHFTRFFNPRIDTWHEHFVLRDAYIEAKTDIAEVTLNILQFNHPERLLERRILIAENHYPGCQTL